MNRSMSKIRHIQEANLKLENRMLNEQSRTHLNEALPVVALASPYIVAGATALAGVLGTAAYNIISAQGASADKVKQFCDLCQKSKVQITQTSNQLADVIRDSVQGGGTNEDVLNRVFNGIKTFDEFCSIVKSYQQSYNTDLYSDLDGDIDREDEWAQIFRPIRDVVLKYEQENAARKQKQQAVAGNPLTQNAGYNKGIYQNQMKMNKQVKK